MIIDTFILACYQTVVNKSQKKQRWWARRALNMSIVLQFVIMALAFDFVLLALCIISSTIIYFAFDGLIDICPEQGLGHDKFLIIGANLYFAFLTVDILMAIFFEISPVRFASALFNFMFMSVFFFLRCGEPKPPEKKHEFKLATELN